MENIKKMAVIKELKDNIATVEVQNVSACENCALAKKCQMEECKGYKIEVPVTNLNDFNIGETVYVKISEKEAFKALFLSYILPLVLVVFSLSVCMIITNDEIKSGIFSIIILIPYYLLLLLSTKRNTIPIHFKLEKISAQKNG